MSTFFFFLCVKFQKLFCTFKKDKTLGLGFKVTRGLARFGRRRRRRALDDDDATWHHHHHHHLASSSSSSFARTEQTVEAWRSIDRFMSRELEVKKTGLAFRYFKNYMHQKKYIYLKKNEKHSLKKLDVFSFGFTT